MKVLALDFDGVVHSYKSGWTSDGDIPDPAIKGAAEGIKRLRIDYKVVIFSARARTVEGRNAIIAWLAKNGIEVDGVTDKKIPAHVYIDDRAICFTGDWNALQEDVKDFMSWQDIEALTKVQMVPTEEVVVEAKEEDDIELDDLFEPGVRPAPEGPQMSDETNTRATGDPQGKIV